MSGNQTRIFEPDKKLLDFEPLMELDGDPETAQVQLIQEVRRLNGITSRSKQSYYRLYEELLRKDRLLKSHQEKLENIEEKNERERMEYQLNVIKLTRMSHYQRKDIEGLKNLLKNKENTLKEESEALDKLANDLEREEIRNRDLQENKGELERQRRFLQEKLDKAEEKIDKLEMALELFKRETKAEEERADHKYWQQKNSFNEVDTENKKLKSLYEVSQDENKFLKRERGIDKENLLEKDKLIEKLRFKIDELKDTVYRTLNENNLEEENEKRLKKELINMKRFVTDVKNAEIETEKVKFEMNSKDDEINHLKIRIEKLKQEKEDLKNEIIQAQEDNSLLKEKQEKFYEDLIDMREIYESQVETLADKLTSLSNTNFEQSVDLENLKKDKRFLQMKLVRVNRKLARKELEYQEMLDVRLFKMSEKDLVKETKIHKNAMKDTLQDRIEFEDASGLNNDEYLRILTEIKSLKL